MMRGAMCGAMKPRFRARATAVALGAASRAASKPPPRVDAGSAVSVLSWHGSCNVRKGTAGGGTNIVEEVVNMANRVTAILVIALLLSPGLLSAAEQQEAEPKPQSQQTELSNSKSFQEGRLAAKREHNAAGWVIGGVVGGGLFSLLGAGAVTGIAAASSPSPDYVPENVDTGSYMTGYEKEARGKNVRGAAISGGIMTALWIVVAVSAAQ
jgi:hypothetical protein